jgi:hypothetical protein
VLVKALVTRYSSFGGTKIPMFVARKYVPLGTVLQWGRVQITEGGDRIVCAKLVKPGALGHDCTFIRVRLFISTDVYYLKA